LLLKYALLAISTEPRIFGREKEMEYLYSVLDNARNSITYIIGESGIGKSSLLEEFYNRIDKRNSDLLIGFYSKDNLLIGESMSTIYPFVNILSNLLDWARRNERPNEKIKGIMSRIETALIDFAKEKGSEMVGAIIHDAAKKLGLDKTLETMEPLIIKLKGSQSAITLATNYAHENSNEPIISFVGIIQTILKQFGNRHLVLIFDQFESVRKSSIDFLINFIRLMQSNYKFHIIVSFKVEEQKWSDTVARELYAYASQHLQELGAKQLKLVGLSEESIGSWIKCIRNVNLDYDKLKEIKKYSAGFPILLKEWIENTKTFDHNEIDRDGLCIYVCLRRKSLSEDDDIKLNKLVILAQLPVTIKQLTQHDTIFKEFYEFIGIDADYYPRFIERLVEKDLFERTSDGYAWFKHELIQMCLEDRIKNEYLNIYVDYHSNAAKFYQKLLEKSRYDNR
jgi:AAA+ ATPase superfamily predicted ATPase